MLNDFKHDFLSIGGWSPLIFIMANIMMPMLVLIKWLWLTSLSFSVVLQSVLSELLCTLPNILSKVLDSMSSTQINILTWSFAIGTTVFIPWSQSN